MSKGAFLFSLFVRFVCQSIRSLLVLGMIAFWFASHTIEAVASFSSAIIEGVANVTTTTTEARTASAAQTRRADEALIRNATLEQRLGASDRELASTRELLAAMEADLADLRSQRSITFRGEQRLPREAMLEVADGIERRTVRAAAANSGAIFGEAVPFYGIAVIVAATSVELKLSCDTMNDLYDLSVALAPETAVPEERTEVCGLQVPTREEVWQGIVASPETVWTASVSAVSSASDYATSLERPNFDGWWSRVLTLIDRFRPEENSTESSAPSQP